MTTLVSFRNRRPITIADVRGLQRLLTVLPISVALDVPALEHSMAIDGASQIAAMGFDWVYIDFFDGFPSEQTVNDTAFFEAAVRFFHEQNIRVSAGIRVSSAFAVGTYAEQEWYARDSHGQLLPAGTKRFYTIIDHPKWADEVRQRIEAVLEAGVDGIVLREVSMGADGYLLGGHTLGMIGSSDAESIAAYLSESGAGRLPYRWRDAKTTQPYFSWRTKRLHAVIATWIDRIRATNADCIVEIELRDPLTRPSFTTQGVDLGLYEGLQAVQLLSTHPDHDSAWWVHNVLAHGTISRYASMVKVGLDEILYHTSRVPPPQSYAHAIARAIAQGDVPHVQSLIKRHNNMLSSVLHRRYLPYQNILTTLNQWQIANQAWLSQREMSSPLAIYLPQELQHQPGTTTIVTLSMIVHGLMVNGYPIRFVDESNWQGVKVLIVPPIERLPSLTALADSGVKIVGVGRRPVDSAVLIWRKVGQRSLRLGSPPFVVHWMNRAAVRMASSYHGRRLVRWIVDWFKRRKFVQTRLQPVKLPTAQMITELMEAIPSETPFVEAPVPILYTIWREPDGTLQHYVVNTTQDAHIVTLHLYDLVSAELYPLEAPAAPARMVGSALTVNLEVAKVIRTQSATIQSTDVER